MSKTLKFNPVIALHILAAANLKQEDPNLELIPDLKAKDAFAKTFARDFGLDYQRGKGGLLPAENSITKDLDRALMALMAGQHKTEELAAVANWSFPDTATINKLTVLAENALNLGYFLPENNGRKRDIEPNAETESLSGSLLSGAGSGGVHIEVPQPDGGTNINSNTDGKTGGLGLKEEEEEEPVNKLRVEALNDRGFVYNPDKNGYEKGDILIGDNQLYEGTDEEFYANLNTLDPKTNGEAE